MKGYLLAAFVVLHLVAALLAERPHLPPRATTARFERATAPPIALPKLALARSASGPRP